MSLGRSFRGDPYVPAFVQKAREVAKTRAREALRAKRAKAKADALKDAASGQQGSWNSNSKVSELFDPTVKKSDIFRLEKRVPKDILRKSELASKSTTVASAMAQVLGDDNISDIFHRGTRAYGHDSGMRVPHSIKAMRASLDNMESQEPQEPERDSVVEIQEMQINPVTSAASSPRSTTHGSTYGSPRSVASRSPNPRGDFHYGPAGYGSSHSPRSPRSGLPQSPQSMEGHGQFAAESEAYREEVEQNEACTSPIDEETLQEMVGSERDGFGPVGMNRCVREAPNPVYFDPADRKEAMVNKLILAVSGLVKSMETKEAMSSKRHLGDTIDQSFVLGGVDGHSVGGGGMLSPHKQQARQFLTDRVSSHFSGSEGVEHNRRVGTRDSREGREREKRERKPSSVKIVYDRPGYNGVPANNNIRDRSNSNRRFQLLTHNRDDNSDDEAGPYQDQNQHPNHNRSGSNNAQSKHAMATAWRGENQMEEAEGPVPPVSVGAIRDLLLTKLQSIERCHEDAVQLLLHEPAEIIRDRDRRDSGFGVGSGSLTTGTSVGLAGNGTDTESGGHSGSGTNSGLGDYVTDTQRLAKAMHSHHAHAHAPPTSNATRLPRARGGESQYHTHAAHSAQAPHSNVISFTKKTDAPVLSGMQRRVMGAAGADGRGAGQEHIEVLYSEGGSGGGGGSTTDDETKDMYHKYYNAFTGNLSAPCYSDTHETALTAPALGIFTRQAELEQAAAAGDSAARIAAKRGKDKKMEATIETGEPSIEAEDHVFMAMREQRREAMQHLPTLHSTAPLEYSCAAYYKEAAFAREMRNLALDARGISFDSYLNRATDMVLDELMEQVGEELDDMLDEHANNFLLKI